jgi:hypothetical protein
MDYDREAGAAIELATQLRTLGIAAVRRQQGAGWMRLLLLFSGFVLATAGNAECVRLKTQHETSRFDGPGSWGPLHNTATLDCLQYAGSIYRDGVEQVLIRDETGTIYRLKVGDFMGEKTGRIAKIDDHYIYVEQYRDNSTLERTVKFKK